MPNDATMTLNLSRLEMDALESIAGAKDMSKTATIRQALRLLQWIDAKMTTHELCWRDKATGQIEQTLILGCGGN